jgi:hypothetical protein
MGVCVYCGQKAGWFHEAHDACVQKAQEGLGELKKCISDAVVDAQTYDGIRERVDKIIADSSIPRNQILPTIKEGWDKGAVIRSIRQPINDKEFSEITGIFKAAGLRAEEMQSTAGWRAMAFSFLIWTVLTDEIEPYQGPVRFNLQAGETPVFGMANVLVSEERTTTSYVGAYSGASIRVAKGVYYHLGGTRGHRVESTAIKELDYGDFLMTTKAVYFGGREHGVNFRLPYKQVVRFQPYSDAVGICKNGSKEKIFAPQKVPESGWFLFNILQALAAKDSGVAS